MLNFKNKPIIGMIHLSGSNNPIDRALKELEIFDSEGVHAAIIENYHGSFEDVLNTIRRIKLDNIKLNLSLGVNILPNEFETAMMTAHLHYMDFIQIDHIAGSYYSGIELDQDYVRRVKSKYDPKIKVLGGVWPKYYKPVKGSILEKDLADGMKRANAIVVTGEGTGKETPLDKIKQFRSIIGDFPLIVGAGMNSSNAKEQMAIADGAIVGSCFKPYNKTTEMVSRELVQEFMNSLK